MLQGRFALWTLLSGDERVPRLALLGLPQKRLQLLNNPELPSVSKARRTKSQPPLLEPVSSFVNWAFAWDEYVRGNIVSRSSASLLNFFLLKTIAASGKNIDSDESEADVVDDDPDLPPLRLPRAKLQEILTPALLDNEGGMSMETNADSKKPTFKEACRKKLNQREYD